MAASASDQSDVSIDCIDQSEAIIDNIIKSEANKESLDQSAYLTQWLRVELLDGGHDEAEVLGPGAGVAGLGVKLQVKSGLEAAQSLGEEDALGEAEPDHLNS